MKRIKNPSEVNGLMAQKKNFFITHNSINGCYYELIDSVPTDWKEIVKKIGGGCKFFESINFLQGGFSLWVDEDGMANKQEPNDAATTIAGFTIFGNAFVIFK